MSISKKILLIPVFIAGVINITSVYAAGEYGYGGGMEANDIFKTEVLTPLKAGFQNLLFGVNQAFGNIPVNSRNSTTLKNNSAVYNAVKNALVKIGNIQSTNSAVDTHNANIATALNSNNITQAKTLAAQEVSFYVVPINVTPPSTEINNLRKDVLGLFNNVNKFIQMLP